MTAESDSLYEKAVRPWILNFRRLTKLRVIIKYFSGGSSSWWFMDNKLGEVVPKLNAHLGSAGRLITVSTRCQFTVWSWEAGQGQTLTWIDEIAKGEDVPLSRSELERRSP